MTKWFQWIALAAITCTAMITCRGCIKDEYEYNLKKKELGIK